MKLQRVCRVPILILSAAAALSACGVHDSDTTVAAAALHAAVADSEPLPVPADTIVPPDANTGSTIAVGTLPGTSSVDDDGSAHYTIPLSVPSGRAGMQPDLALEYSSRGGNGLLGVGWSLTGFSQMCAAPTTTPARAKAGR